MSRVKELNFSVNSREIAKECADLPFDHETDHIQIIALNLNDDYFHIDPEGYTGTIIKQVHKQYSTNCATIRILKPAAGFPLHTDDGKASKLPHSYHIVLEGDPQNFFLYPLDDQQQCIPVNKPNCLYQCDVLTPHSFVNLSKRPRSHLTFFKNPDEGIYKFSYLK